MRRWLAAITLLGALGLSADANAQAVSPVPKRDVAWQTVTGVTLGLGAASQLLMPRIFYADPEVTVGWKARWHVSVLAPVMTLAMVGVLNEYVLKDAIKGDRPDCDDSNRGLTNCTTYGMVSSHSFGAGASLGHGAAVFLFDTTKWGGGKWSGYSLAGNVAFPLVTGALTVIGRAAGNWESGGQIVAGGLAGLAFGFLTGTMYTLMQRPECGYTGSLVCW